MKNKRKNGFTLVELLAVVVILIVIGLIAVDRVKKSTEKASRNAASSNAISYIEAVNDFLSIDNLTSAQYRYGNFTLENLTDMGIKVDGTIPKIAFVNVEEFKVVKACLQYETYRVMYENGEYKTPTRAKCKQSTISNQTLLQEYTYTGQEQTFTAPETGNYLLEVWGAQGGSSIDFIGGYGGYATGVIHLTAGEILYVNVGGKGVESGTDYPYNGGGRGTSNRGSSGGGATSIATRSGEIRNLLQSDLIIVAGGGGGSIHWEKNWTSGHGGVGGGFVGGDGTTTGWAKAPGLGGTQTAGGAPGKNSDNNDSATAGSFGQGGIYFQSTSQSPGGGGGLYGGGSSYFSGAGGGSGYIGNPRLSQKIMYCYKCTTSDDVSTKTKSTKQVDSNPISKVAKEADGFAKIYKM